MSFDVIEPNETLPASIVLVVDDDKVLRQALGSLLKSVDHSILEFGNPMEMLAHPATSSAACVILDVRLQGFNGLDVHLQMCESGIDIPVIFITGHGDIPMSVRAMKAGAVDFFAKPFNHQDLLDSVAKAVERHQEGLKKRYQLKLLTECLNSLTPREKQVMTGVINGLMNKQIAGSLNISEITVKMHRASVMRKMGVTSIASLVRAARLVGLG